MEGKEQRRGKQGPIRKDFSTPRRCWRIHPHESWVPQGASTGLRAVIFQAQMDVNQDQTVTSRSERWIQWLIFLGEKPGQEKQSITASVSLFTCILEGNQLVKQATLKPVLQGIKTAPSCTSRYWGQNFFVLCISCLKGVVGRSRSTLGLPDLPPYSAWLWWYKLNSAGRALDLIPVSPHPFPEPQQWLLGHIDLLIKIKKSCINV